MTHFTTLIVFVCCNSSAHYSCGGISSLCARADCDRLHPQTDAVYTQESYMWTTAAHKKVKFELGININFARWRCHYMIICN